MGYVLIKVPWSSRDQNCHRSAERVTLDEDDAAASLCRLAIEHWLKEFQQA
jgi:hypothetical protein